jgi:hypothetical protein
MIYFHKAFRHCFLFVLLYLSKLVIAKIDSKSQSQSVCQLHEARIPAWSKNPLVTKFLPNTVIRSRHGAIPIVGRSDRTMSSPMLCVCPQSRGCLTGNTKSIIVHCCWCIYRVSHIRCSTARHERGCAACPRREQGKATLRRLAAVKTQ